MKGINPGPYGPAPGQGEKTGFRKPANTWNHDALGYLKLRPYVPEVISWVIRYHSLKRL